MEVPKAGNADIKNSTFIFSQWNEGAIRLDSLAILILIFYTISVTTLTKVYGSYFIMVYAIDYALSACIIIDIYQDISASI